MRRLAFALVLLATPAQAQSARVLTHAEVVSVFEDRQACFVPTGQGACSSVQTVLESGADALRTRTVGLTSLVGFSDEPLNELVRGLSVYQPYADLFATLEAQRASLGALYLKQVETSVEHFDPQARGYCEQTDALTALRETDFYFSSNTSSNTDQDQRLSDSHAERLREFFVALFADAEFRAAVPDQEFTLLLDVMIGVRPICRFYAGGELNNELLLVGAVAFSGDVQINSLTEAVEMRPSSEALQLVPE